LLGFHDDTSSKHNFEFSPGSDRFKKSAPVFSKYLSLLFRGVRRE
jgi:hypothetical protein